jgi:enoyl-CoA hydratase/carnithine racemase
MGLVNKVFPAASFMDDATSFAKELATMVSPRSMRVMKKQLWTTQISRDLGDAVLSGNAEMLTSFECADFKEGVAHFVEQRAPAFTGT